MARGRKKGKQSGGAGSKSERYAAWLKVLHEARWELRKSNTKATTAGTGKGLTKWRSNIRWRQGVQQPQRFNGHAAARFLESYLRGPPVPSAHALTEPVGGNKRGGTSGGSPDEEREGEGEEIGLEAWLWRERRGQQRQRVLAGKQQGADAAVAGIPDVEAAEGVVRAAAAAAEVKDVAEDEEKDGSVKPLTTLCCLQIGQDLPLYAAAAAASTTKDDEDEDEDEDAAAEAIQALFSLLPQECLERIALASSEEGLVDDGALTLLCQPSAKRLVLVGTFTEKGMARSVCLLVRWQWGG